MNKHKLLFSLASCALLVAILSSACAQQLASPDALNAPPAGTGGFSLQFKVDVQPLAQALKEVAQQASVEIKAAPELVSGKTSTAVSGRLSAVEALRQVLAGTGLEAVWQGGAYVIQRKAGA